ncbi:MAG: metallophosphoesterase family protein [Desulfuromonadales bacterium]|nr:metallophosphoesterase family protein [Desulfuromonadales bacterium]
MRLLTIGDVHGQSQRLVALLEKVRPQPQDQLVMLGDYIDRGPDSRGVVDKLIRLRRNCSRVVFLRGNHEQMLLDALYELHLMGDWHPLRSYSGTPEWPPGAVMLHALNGGDATLISYGHSCGAGDEHGVEVLYRAIPQAHVDFFRRTLLFYRYGRFLFVHAGVDPEDPLGAERGPFELLWRRTFAPCQIDGERVTVVHGHTPCARPLYTQAEISLDTGAGFGRELTCCDVLTGELWQA